MDENELSKSDKVQIAIVGAAAGIIVVSTLVLYNKYLGSVLDILGKEADKLTEAILEQGLKK